MTRAANQRNTLLYYITDQFSKTLVCDRKYDNRLYLNYDKNENGSRTNDETFNKNEHSPVNSADKKIDMLLRRHLSTAV